MTTTRLGKVALTPRGAYDAGTAYAALDVVEHGGSAFGAPGMGDNLKVKVLYALGSRKR